jgi:uncharacterized protein
MSELINNTANRKELLKHLILQLHKGEAPAQVKQQLAQVLKSVPYDDVVAVEQELISEGLPTEEVLKLCDLHAEVLDGHIDQSGAKEIPAGHPVDTFKKENRELEKLVDSIEEKLDAKTEVTSPEIAYSLLSDLNSLMDVDKHYRRKENLLFPFLEKKGITGPPTVMWGKHDETRNYLKESIELVNNFRENNHSFGELRDKIKVALKAITDMIMKEEEILFPMTMDELTDAEWHQIYLQTNEIGYCLFDPKEDWMPLAGENSLSEEFQALTDGKIHLPSGSFSADELTALLNTLPVDITFVDKNDKVKYFTQGEHRIFDRNRAILGRDVRMCHPPHSVHIVEQILADFKSGKEKSAPFWIQMGGKFIYINYFPLRDKQGNYLGTIEFSQDLTELRALEGEQRLLSYGK